ncbi:discs large protein [Clonorchis sinensis]|uniref:Discs large protein n=1 Tax=Clonorchis sinensis TaxID=79923 RepID=G7YVU6_CLOSI|nr:discs large protein [Clonorchis sinensis]
MPPVLDTTGSISDTRLVNYTSCTLTSPTNFPLVPNSTVGESKVVLGDFNLPDISWSPTLGPTRYASMLAQLSVQGWSQIVRSPTHGLHTLDLIFSNEGHLATAAVGPCIPDGLIALHHSTGGKGCRDRSMNIETINPSLTNVSPPKPRFARNTPTHLRQTSNTQPALLSETVLAQEQQRPTLSASRTDSYDSANLTRTTNNMRACSLESFPAIPCLTTTIKKSMVVRALFDYDPYTDTGLPGRGLAFQHGDILYVVNANDQEWWQARRLMLLYQGTASSANPRSCDSLSATSTLTTRSPLGIIPSCQRIERRQRARLKRVNFFSKVTVIGSNHVATNPTAVLPPSRSVASTTATTVTTNNRFRADSETPPSPSPLTNGQNGESFPGHVSTLDRHGKHYDELGSIRSYETVIPLTIHMARPLLIFGPLKERVIDALLQDPKYATCVPHTTRPPRTGERDGVDYYFVKDRAQMEEDIKTDRFVEVGQFQDQYYATSVDSVRRTLQAGRVCVLDVSLPAIRRLELAGLHPISILLQPLSAMHLRAIQRRLTEEQAKRSVDMAQRLEADNWRLFSTIITYDSIETAVSGVKRFVQLNGGPVIWVPSSSATNSNDEPSIAGSQSSTLPRGLHGPVSPS